MQAIAAQVARHARAAVGAIRSAKADRTCASSTMSSSWRRQAGRPFQAKSPL
jgi:uncharacterized protein YukE